MSIHNIPLSIYKKKSPKYNNVCSYGIFCWGLENKFQTCVILSIQCLSKGDNSLLASLGDKTLPKRGLPFKAKIIPKQQTLCQELTPT